MNSSSFNHPATLNKIPKENTHVSSNVQVILCSNEEELKTYCMKRSVDPQYRCNICSKKYTSHSALKIHRIRHKEKEDLPFHCMFCPFRAAAKRDLLRHHDQHVGHARQIFKCCQCTKSFKNSASLNEHTKSVHIQDTLYKCGLCSFTCWRRSGFRLHLKYHHAKVQIICPICDATFQTKSNLQIHLRTHAGAKPFACDKCDKRFIVKNQLTGHQQRVHAPRTFDCDLCQKRFPTVHHLKRHSLIHTGERPFKCCFCTYDSNTQGNLVKHVRRIHRVFHFTYKDVLMKRGIIDDAQKGLTAEDIKRMTECGREASESYIKALRDKGLTSASLEQLEREMSAKRKSKAALEHAHGEKKRKSRKSKSNIILRKDVVKVGNSKGRKHKKEKDRLGFNFPNCSEFVLPPIEDVVQPTDNAGVEGLSTTPTIQVIWNVNYAQNIQKSSLNVKTKSKRPQRSRLKNKKRKSVKRKVMLCGSVDDEQGDLCRSDSSPNSPSNTTLTLDVAHPGDNDQPPSNMLDDNDLAFTDKPLHHLQDSSNLRSCTSNVLVTPLDNLHSDLVGFDEIEAPNAVVVTSEGISYIDKVYKNLDLCNQFLHINDDESHFINTFDSGNLQREAKVSKSENQTCSNELTCRDQVKEYDSLEVREVSVSDSDMSETRVCNKTESTESCLDKVDKSRQIEGFTSDHLQASFTPLLENEVKSRINICGTEDSNLIIDIEPIEDNTVYEESIDASKTDPEEIILFDESTGGRGGMVSSLLLIPEDASSRLLKEITIKGLCSSQRLTNDEMEVTSIAEIDENEKEVVLVIDALS